MAKDLDGWSIGKEVIFARQPDFIIVRKEDLKRFVSTSPYNKLKAVKENKGFCLVQDLFTMKES
mgnify:CR=1 FL=1